MPSDDEVSVRDLRQNLSVHLRRLREGRTLAVTSRGERVAVLAPIDGGSRVERLVAEGRATPPAHPRSDLMPAPSDGLADRLVSEAVLADRHEDLR